MAASLAAAAASASVLLAAAGEVPGSVRPCSGRLAASFPCAGRRRRPAAGVRCGGGGLPAAEAEEGGRFVGWFREAWPYIRGHRGSTFVVVISGEVVAGPHLDGILQVSLPRTSKEVKRDACCDADGSVPRKLKRFLLI